jgi:hypothetical protein
LSEQVPGFIYELVKWTRVALSKARSIIDELTASANLKFQTCKIE